MSSVTFVRWGLGQGLAITGTLCLPFPSGPLTFGLIVQTGEVEVLLQQAGVGGGRHGGHAVPLPNELLSQALQPIFGLWSNLHSSAFHLGGGQPARKTKEKSPQLPSVTKCFSLQPVHSSQLAKATQSPDPRGELSTAHTHLVGLEIELHASGFSFRANFKPGSYQNGTKCELHIPRQSQEKGGKCTPLRGAGLAVGRHTCSFYSRTGQV